ncbi:septum formation family protein [Nocardioides sp. BP30]|uniref:septum formation family protein n=1 Tax=Nocardioides sp. BP30 TaxID=3036374 RepID=UPI002469A048|nr:septum formation family protein [Nocardioides sp. BP30]WGL51124.1 septum formation family protein [Nocardioides sp. BP30]
MTRMPTRVGAAPGAAALAAVLTVMLAVVLSGCGGSSSARPKAPASSAPPPVASAVPRPAASGCSTLTYQQAVAPTLPAGETAVPCSGTHTAQTYAVGTLSTAIDGHLTAVDSARVQAQVAKRCPAALPAYLGGDRERLRLSMLRGVWFTPTVAQASTGADWYRCDVIALDGDQQLASMRGSLKGVLGSARAGDWAMCGTAQPGTAGFHRVPCRAKHSWKALKTIDLPAGDYPGEAAVKEAGQKPCQQAGQAVASDALNYRWGYEWPTAEQWKAGQTYGICWAPSA